MHKPCGRADLVPPNMNGSTVLVDAADGEIHLSAAS